MSKKILIVDDHPPMIGLLTEGLERAGYSVISANNGEDGLLGVREHNPDLMILDLAMPGIDGIEVLRELRHRPESQLLPVIILSGRQGYADVLNGWISGADRYLTKPCSFEKLLETVKLMLANTAPH